MKQKIEEKAEEILRTTGSFQIPIQVDVVAHRLGLQVQAAILGEDISGILVVDGGQGTIGYNQHQAEVRQHFTIAHEIGHFLLHLDKEGHSDLFVDRRYAAIYHRDGRSAAGEDENEREANQFAAALLMPASLLCEEVEKHDFDFGDEEALDLLAKRFQVSTQAMSIRLAALGIFK